MDLRATKSRSRHPEPRRPIPGENANARVTNFDLHAQAEAVNRLNKGRNREDQTKTSPQTIEIAVWVVL